MDGYYRRNSDQLVCILIDFWIKLNWILSYSNVFKLLYISKYNFG